MFRSKKYKNILLFAGNFVYQDSYNKAKLKITHDNCARRLIKSAVGIMLTIIFSSFPTVLYPVYLHFFENARPMIVPIILPFIDPETTNGYYKNICNQLVFCIVGLMGNVGIECISAFWVNNIEVSIETIRFELNELSDALLSDIGTELNKKMKLRNILIQMQDVDR